MPNLAGGAGRWGRWAPRPCRGRVDANQADRDGKGVRAEGKARAKAGSTKAAWHFWKPVKSYLHPTTLPEQHLPQPHPLSLPLCLCLSFFLSSWPSLSDLSDVPSAPSTPPKALLLWPLATTCSWFPWARFGSSLAGLLSPEARSLPLNALFFSASVIFLRPCFLFFFSELFCGVFIWLFDSNFRVFQALFSVSKHTRSSEGRKKDVGISSKEPAC